MTLEELLVVSLAHFRHNDMRFPANQGSSRINQTKNLPASILSFLITNSRFINMLTFSDIDNSLTESAFVYQYIDSASRPTSNILGSND